MTRVGNSELDVAAFALGGNVFGWTADEETSFRVLDAFVDGGGNLIDTADSYSAWAPGHKGGESETIIGTWLERSGRRDDVLIATKVSQHPDFKGLAADNIAKAARASLQRLRIDHIDLYWAHFDDESTPIEETAAAFDQLVREGLVRSIGLSNYAAPRIQEWISIAKAKGFAVPVALQPHYNLVTREPYESSLAPVAAEENLGVFPYFSLAAGFLTGKYRTSEDIQGKDRSGQLAGYFSDAGLKVVDALDGIATAHGVPIASVALSWLAAQPQIVAPIASARNLEQLPALFDSVTLQLDDAELGTLGEVSSAVNTPAQA